MCGWKRVSAGNKSAHSSESKSPNHVTLGGMTQTSSQVSREDFWARVSRRLLVSSRSLFWLLPVPGRGGYTRGVAEHETWKRGHRLSQGQYIIELLTGFRSGWSRFRFNCLGSTVEYVLGFGVRRLLN